METIFSKSECYTTFNEILNITWVQFVRHETLRVAFEKNPENQERKSQSQMRHMYLGVWEKPFELYAFLWQWEATKIRIKHDQTGLTHSPSPKNIIVGSGKSGIPVKTGKLSHLIHYKPVHHSCLNRALKITAKNHNICYDYYKMTPDRYLTTKVTHFNSNSN